MVIVVMPWKTEPKTPDAKKAQPLQLSLPFPTPAINAQPELVQAEPKLPVRSGWGLRPSSAMLFIFVIAIFLTIFIK